MPSVTRMLKAVKEDWILYLLFIMTTFGRHVEPFAIVAWMIIMKQTRQTFSSARKLFPLFLYLMLSSFIGFCITQFPMDMFWEQTAQLIVYMSIYYTMMVFYQNRLDHVFNVYCNVAFVLAFMGIIQYILGRFFGMSFLFAISGREAEIGDLMRARAWMGEASYFAMYLVPAMVYNSMNEGIENYRSIIFIIAGLLSFSPVFKMTLILFLIYYLVSGKFSFKRWMLYITAGVAIFLISRNYSFSEYDRDEVKSSETIEYLGADFSELESANLSTYSLLKNLKIAMMADNRLTGTGLGTHGYSHDKYYSSPFEYSSLNKYDAFSLGVRIFSELGIVGLLAFIFFIVAGFNKHNYINVSSAFYLLYCLCRGGHYTLFGLQFFIMIFFFTSKFRKHYTYDIDNRHSRP